MKNRPDAVGSWEPIIDGEWQKKRFEDYETVVFIRKIYNDLEFLNCCPLYEGGKKTGEIEWDDGEGFRESSHKNIPKIYSHYVTLKYPKTPVNRSHPLAKGLVNAWVFNETPLSKKRRSDE